MVAKEILGLFHSEAKNGLKKFPLKIRKVMGGMFALQKLMNFQD